MAVIGKIQKNSLLLLVVIGLAMLAFIFTDFLRNSGPDIEQLNTATLYGEPIDEQKYDELRELYVNRSKNEFAYQNKEWTPAAERTAEDNAFNELVRRTLLDTEFEKLGIVCTTDELNDMIHGNHIHPWVIQIPIFNGTTGFSKDSVKNFLNTLEVEPVGADEQTRSSWLESRRQWREFEKELKEARKADKYVALVKKGMYVNKLEAQDQYNAVYGKKQIRFVFQRYGDIPLDEVTVSDEEIMAYFEEHKDEKKFEQEEARDIQMITFPVVPTEQDKIEIRSELENLAVSFEASQNPVGFVFQNSDNKFLSDTTVFRMGGDQMAYNTAGGSYPKSADDAVQEAQIGDVIGPFETTNGELAIAKVLDTPTEKQAWVRHILISTQGGVRTEDRAKAISDSLIRVIKAEDNFAELVPIMSEDPGSVNNGGEYKWFSEGVMVPEFNDAAFNGAIGQVQLVKTTFGYHIVEVLGQAERVTPVLSVVTKAVKPSEQTLTDIEERAYDYIYSVSESDDDSAFYNIATDSSKVVQSARIFLSNDYVLGMQESSRMLRFAFNANTVEGDISDPILDGNKYVVALISNVVNEGTPEFEDVKELMRTPALHNKQAEVYIQKMSGKGSLEDVASELNLRIQQSEVTFNGDIVFNGGRKEPEVVGKLFTDIPSGSMTLPIQGLDGVYVFIIDEELPAPETTDYTATIAPMLVQRMQGSDNQVINALREKADLVDNRRKIKFQQ